MIGHNNDLHPLIYDFSFQELTELVQTWGEQKYRADQIWKGLYRNFWESPNQFIILPSHIRELLDSQFTFSHLSLEKQLYSDDGETLKCLFRLADGNAIESVLMTYKRRRTICISTQSGCGMGCVFCATGQMGFRRNLSVGEIIEQVLFFSRILRSKNQKITNIVIMGMGEPFQNYETVMEAINRLNDPEGFNFGERRFTVSTVGLIPAIRRFADDKRQVNLAVSLHAAENELRSTLMPINRQYPLQDLLEACRYYVSKTRRRISFEWALIENVNDNLEEARLLAKLLKGLMCHVNVIPLNPILEYDGKPTSYGQARAFQKVMVESGIPCTIRLGRGIDIGAGCGQLAVENNETDYQEMTDD
jgi:23S rRNA (adenine2503-C2)-methyltransferase